VGHAKRRDLLAKKSLEFDVLARQASACTGESRGQPHDLVEKARRGAR
jgi:hypothetical protein